jgi:hypothetical protein
MMLHQIRSATIMRSAVSRHCHRAARSGSWHAVLLATALSASRAGSTAAFSTMPIIAWERHQHHSSRPSHDTRRWLSSKDSVEKDPRESGKDPRESILQRTPEQDKKMVERTLDWLQRVVIGLNLCPFADKPFKDGNVHVEVIDGSDQVEILSRVLAECFVRQNKPGTSLMVCPELFPSNFDSFLEVYNMLQEGVLVEHELTEDLQVAPFHPFFEFDGSGSDGIDNYTNRSPYPIFHILREEEVEHAVDLLDGDAGKVWKRNVRLLEELDSTFDRSQVEQLMSGQPQEEEYRKAVKAILRKLKNSEE